MWTNGKTHSLLVGKQIVKTLWQTVEQFLKLLNIYLPLDTAILLLYIYPREMKIHVSTKICSPIFIAAFFHNH